MRPRFERIEHELRTAHSEGRLKFFNRSYRKYRTSGGTLPYPQAYARLRRALFTGIAAGRLVRVDVNLLGEIFGGTFAPAATATSAT